MRFAQRIIAWVLSFALVASKGPVCILTVVFGGTSVQVCVDIFQERGHQADVKNQLSVEQLHGIVGNYDGMVIRSATKVWRMENASTTVQCSYCFVAFAIVRNMADGV